MFGGDFINEEVRGISSKPLLSGINTVSSGLLETERVSRTRPRGLRSGTQEENLVVYHTLDSRLSSGHSYGQESHVPPSIKYLMYDHKIRPENKFVVVELKELLL